MFKISQYYPFSASSTMQLYGDVKLPFNLVYGCILYPRLTEESIQSSLEVRRVYTRFMDGPDFEHHWIIQNSDGSISLDEAAENLKRATRRYAKRQLTWFNRNKDIYWIYMDECDDPTGEAERYIRASLPQFVSGSRSDR